jgi:hypothetical protein
VTNSFRIGEAKALPRRRGNVQSATSHNHLCKRHGCFERSQLPVDLEFPSYQGVNAGIKHCDQSYSIASSSTSSPSFKSSNLQSNPWQPRQPMNWHKVSTCNDSLKSGWDGVPSRFVSRDFYARWPITEPLRQIPETILAGSCCPSTTQRNDFNKGFLVRLDILDWSLVQSRSCKKAGVSRSSDSVHHRESKAISCPCRGARPFPQTSQGRWNRQWQYHHLCRREDFTVEGY